MNSAAEVLFLSGSSHVLCFRLFSKRLCVTIIVIFAGGGSTLGIVVSEVRWIIRGLLFSG